MLDISWNPSLCISTFTTQTNTREVLKIYFRNTKMTSFWIPHTTHTDTHAESPLLTQDDVSVPLHCLQQHFDLSEGEPWFGFQTCSYSSDFKLLIFIAPRGWHGWPLSSSSDGLQQLSLKSNFTSFWDCFIQIHLPAWTEDTWVTAKWLERSESNTER